MPDSPCFTSSSSSSSEMFATFLSNPVVWERLRNADVDELPRQARGKLYTVTKILMHEDIDEIDRGVLPLQADLLSMLAASSMAEEVMNYNPQTSSVFHQEVSDCLTKLGVEHKNEAEDDVDIKVETNDYGRVAIQVDGPSHYNHIVDGTSLFESLPPRAQM